MLSGRGLRTVHSTITLEKVLNTMAELDTNPGFEQRAGVSEDNTVMIEISADPAVEPSESGDISKLRPLVSDLTRFKPFRRHAQ